MYGFGQQAQNDITLPTTLSTTETDLVIIKDHKYLQASQFTIMVSVDLGAVTSCTFYYYYSPDEGTTWYPVSLYDTSTGKMTQRSVVVDSGTYATSGHSMFIDNIGLGACTRFKVTGKSASATPTLNNVIVSTRNN